MVTVSLLSRFKITVLLGNGQEQKTSLLSQFSRPPSRFFLLVSLSSQLPLLFKRPATQLHPPSAGCTSLCIRRSQGVFFRVSV